MFIFKMLYIGFCTYTYTKIYIKKEINLMIAYVKITLIEHVYNIAFIIFLVN